jgi:hypothetical protein
LGTAISFPFAAVTEHAKVANVIVSKKESYTPDYVDHVENFGFVCVDYKKKIGVEMQRRLGCRKWEKRPFWGIV